MLGTVGHQGVLFYVLVGLLAVPALVVSGGAAWDDLLDIDWGTLLLLGGGISLANALADTNATKWLAEVTFGSFAGSSVIAVLVVVVTMTIVVGELASNTAMAALLAPLLVNIGPAYAAALGTSSEVASVLLAVTGGSPQVTGSRCRSRHRSTPSCSAPDTSDASTYSARGRYSTLLLSF